MFILTNTTAHGTSSFPDVPSAPPCLEGAPCESRSLTETSKNKPPFAADIQGANCLLAPPPAPPPPPLQDWSFQMNRDPPPTASFQLSHLLEGPSPDAVTSWIRRSIHTFGCYYCCCLVAKLCLILWSQGVQIARLLYPLDSPGKNTGVSWHFLLQGIFLAQGSSPPLLRPLQSRQILYRWDPGEAPGHPWMGHSSVQDALVPKLRPRTHFLKTIPACLCLLLQADRCCC